MSPIAQTRHIPATNNSNEVFMHFLLAIPLALPVAWFLPPSQDQAIVEIAAVVGAAGKDGAAGKEGEDGQSVALPVKK
jgi:hypothetical protein